MPYLTAQQVRDRARSDDLNDPVQFPDATLEELIEEFEEIAEDYCGVAFIPRTETVLVDGCRTNVLFLKPKITAVGAFTVGGDASTIYELTDAASLEAGILRLSSYASSEVSVTYTHGFATTPKTILRACVQYVRASALRDDTGAGRDVVRQGFEGGSTVYATPNKAERRPTGYITVDGLLNNAPNYVVPGIA